MDLPSSHHSEDNLWSKFKKIKAVMEATKVNPGTLGFARYDDSGRFVDMVEVYDKIFVGSE